MSLWAISNYNQYKQDNYQGHDLDEDIDPIECCDLELDIEDDEIAPSTDPVNILVGLERRVLMRRHPEVLPMDLDDLEADNDDVIAINQYIDRRVNK